MVLDSNYPRKLTVGQRPPGGRGGGVLRVVRGRGWAGVSLGVSKWGIWGGKHPQAQASAHHKLPLGLGLALGLAFGLGLGLGLWVGLGVVLGSGLSLCAKWTKIAFGRLAAHGASGAFGAR